jgi:two-component system, LytTR family, response regulator
MPVRIVIVEDEPATARNLQYLLKEIEEGIEVKGSLNSIAETVSWLRANKTQYDLLFMDIRLNDGLSFEIFEKVKIDKPVIFVTAYSDYALKAFKANGIDYILKPFDAEELKRALAKFKMLQKSSGSTDNQAQFNKLAETLKATNYKQSFLVQFRDKLIPLAVNDITWFYTTNEITYVYTLDKNKYIVDFTLEQLQQQLDPNLFFRANRQFIVHRKFITEIDFYFNGRLLVKMQQEPEEQIIVSKARAPEFKAWMNA